MTADIAVALAAEFERCKGWLQAALDRGGEGTHTLRDVLEALLAGRAHLWPGTKSALVTEFVYYPRSKTLNLWLAGGDLLELRDMEPKLLEFGLANGCDAMELSGRKGWCRALAMHGPKVIRTTLRKRIAP